MLASSTVQHARLFLIVDANSHCGVASDTLKVQKPALHASPAVHDMGAWAIPPASSTEHAHPSSPLGDRRTTCARAQVQDVMMQGSWTDDILMLPNCQVEMDENNAMIWNGPRIKLGLCEGEPAVVCPHTTSGRADYFGPVVNRRAPLACSVLRPFSWFGGAVQPRAVG